MACAFPAGSVRARTRGQHAERPRGRQLLLPGRRMHAPRRDLRGRRQRGTGHDQLRSGGDDQARIPAAGTRRVRSRSTRRPPPAGKARPSSTSTGAKPNSRGGPGGFGSAKTPPRISTGWGSANSTSASGSNRDPRAGPAETSSAPTSPGPRRGRTTTASGSTKARGSSRSGANAGKTAAATSSPATPSGGSSPPARNSKSTEISSAPTRRAKLHCPTAPTPKKSRPKAAASGSGPMRSK